MDFPSIIFIVFFTSLVCDYLFIQIGSETRGVFGVIGTGLALAYQVGIFAVIVMILVCLIFLKCVNLTPPATTSSTSSSKKRKLQQSMYLQALGQIKKWRREKNILKAIQFIQNDRVLQKIMDSQPQRMQKYFRDTVLEIQKETQKNRKEKNVFKLIQNIVEKAPVGSNQRQLQEFQGLINMETMKEFYREVKNHNINFSLRNLNPRALMQMT